MSYFGGAYFDQSPYFNPGTPVTVSGGKLWHGKERKPFVYTPRAPEEDQTPLILLLL